MPTFGEGASKGLTSIQTITYSEKTGIKTFLYQIQEYFFTVSDASFWAYIMPIIPPQIHAACALLEKFWWISLYLTDDATAKLDVT